MTSTDLFTGPPPGATALIQQESRTASIDGVNDHSLVHLGGRDSDYLVGGLKSLCST